MADLVQTAQGVATAAANPLAVAASVQRSLQSAVQRMTTYRMLLLTATWLSAYGGLPEPPKMIKRIIAKEEAQYALLFALLLQGTADGDFAMAAVATGGIYLLIKTLDAIEEQRNAQA